MKNKLFYEYISFSQYCAVQSSRDTICILCVVFASLRFFFVPFLFFFLCFASYRIWYVKILFILINNNSIQFFKSHVAALCV